MAQQRVFQIISILKRVIFETVNFLLLETFFDRCAWSICFRKVYHMLANSSYLKSSPFRKI